MNLYEMLDPGSSGESYFRCYCWAESEEIAREMWRKEFGGRKIERLITLFASTDAPFITEMSDCGFEKSHG